MNFHVAATPAPSAFPTISEDHPHQLRTTVRHIATGKMYRVLGLIIWSADHFDSCDDVICAPVRDGAPDFSSWETFKEHELKTCLQ